MKMSDLQQLSQERLVEELVTSKRELLNLRIQQGVGQQVSKPHLFKQVRRNIARINTALQQKRVNDE